jgi:NTP pyrophosphatase (non-canonical NTP hydrolase)
MGQIKDLTKQAHDNAVRHGFYEKEPSFGDLIARICCELSEAMEDYINKDIVNLKYYSCPLCEANACDDSCDCEECNYENKKPEGVPSELADAVIVIFSMCGHYGIDLESAIIDKMEYNKTRPYKHGREG